MSSQGDRYRPSMHMFLIGILDLAIGAMLLFPPATTQSVIIGCAVLPVGGYLVYCGIRRGCR